MAHEFPLDVAAAFTPFSEVEARRMRRYSRRKATTAIDSITVVTPRPDDPRPEPPRRLSR